MKEEYYNLVYHIPAYTKEKIFLREGQLIIALFEFRAIEEIIHVVNGVLRVYAPKEIGLAIVYGRQNDKYVENLFKDWKNIILINTGDYNHTSITYSQRLQTPELWENFSNFKYVLVTQCDALLLRKIPQDYFRFDYIGAPWSEPTISHLAGNGGFSLRNVEAMVRACERFRGKQLSAIELPFMHEDGFFCRQQHMHYPNEHDKSLHSSFCIEGIFDENPVGLHKPYGSIKDAVLWKKILDNIRKKLLDNVIRFKYGAAHQSFVVTDAACRKFCKTNAEIYCINKEASFNSIFGDVIVGVEKQLFIEYKELTFFLPEIRCNNYILSAVNDQLIISIN